jgi:hypothetical protein
VHRPSRSDSWAVSDAGKAENGQSPVDGLAPSSQEKATCSCATEAAVTTMLEELRGKQEMRKQL